MAFLLARQRQYLYLDGAAFTIIPLYFNGPKNYVREQDRYAFEKGPLTKMQLGIWLAELFLMGLRYETRCLLIGQKIAFTTLITRVTGRSVSLS